MRHNHHYLEGVVPNVHWCPIAQEYREVLNISSWDMLYPSLYKCLSRHLDMVVLLYTVNHQVQHVL